MRVVVVGGKGRFGSWLVRLCREKLGDDVESFDIGESQACGRALQDADVAILSVPIDATPKEAARVGRNLPKGGLVVDVSGFKMPVFQVFEDRPLDYALIHPMCAPPAELDLKGEPVLVARERVEREANAEWLGRFMSATGGRRVDSTVSEHDRLVGVLQAVPHAMLLGCADALLRADVTLERALETATTLSRPIYESLQRFLEKGSPELFSAIQRAAASDARHDYLPGFVRVVADLVSLVRAENPDKALVRRWAEAREKLVLAATVATP